MKFKSLAIGATFVATILPLSRANAQMSQINVGRVEAFIDATAQTLKWKEDVTERRINPRTGALLSSTYTAVKPEDDAVTFYHAHLDYKEPRSFLNKVVMSCTQKDVQEFKAVVMNNKGTFIRNSNSVFTSDSSVVKNFTKQFCKSMW